MRYDDPSATTGAVVGVIGAILLFVIVVVLQAVFYRADEAERARKVYSQPYEELVRGRSQQVEKLNSYRWVDQRAGVVGIPIERAMERVVAESSQSQTRSQR